MTSAKRFLLMLACLVVASTGFAGRKTVAAADTLTASQVFADIPLSVLDMLRPSTRLDMIDYYQQADSLLTVADALGGQSRFEVVTPDYIRLSVTPVSTLEIKLLPYRKGKIVMTLYTVGDDTIAKDTEVNFFDSALQPLDAGKFLKAPAPGSFFNLANVPDGMSDLSELLPFATVEYTTGPGDTPLSATFTALTRMSDETRAILTPLLTPTLTSGWKSGYRF